MDAHIDRVVSAMIRAGMNQAEIFYEKFSNNMVLDFGNHHQHLENILPKEFLMKTRKIY